MMSAQVTSFGRSCALRAAQVLSGRSRPLALLSLAVLLSAVALPTAARALDSWSMSITVDNYYTVYFGDSTLSTPNLVGSDGDWTTTETWNATANPTDYLYVATASDFSVAQGFLGEFNNLTTAKTFVTSAATSSPWQVFAAGAYLPQLNALDNTIPAGSWPVSTQPTTSQVQTAIGYATANNLWIAPDTLPNFTNGDNPSPWGTRPSISATAEWIWHDTGFGPFTGGNNEEFLVFRIAGQPVPEPASLALLGCGLAAVALACWRRKNRALAAATA